MPKILIYGEFIISQNWNQKRNLSLQIIINRRSKIYIKSAKFHNQVKSTILIRRKAIGFRI